jgi:hypothetical protein
MNEMIEKATKQSGGRWTPYEDGEWHGSDRNLPDGSMLRLAREGGHAEPAIFMRFDRSMMLEWRIEFSASCPATVLGAALNEAVMIGGGK